MYNEILNMLTIIAPIAAAASVIVGVLQNFTRDVQLRRRAEFWRESAIAADSENEKRTCKDLERRTVATMVATEVYRGIFWMFVRTVAIVVAAQIGYMGYFFSFSGAHRLALALIGFNVALLLGLISLLVYRAYAWMACRDQYYEEGCIPDFTGDAWWELVRSKAPRHAGKGVICGVLGIAIVLFFAGHWLYGILNDAPDTFESWHLWALVAGAVLTWIGFMISGPNSVTLPYTQKSQVTR